MNKALRRVAKSGDCIFSVLTSPSKALPVQFRRLRRRRQVPYTLCLECAETASDGSKSTFGRLGGAVCPGGGVCYRLCTVCTYSTGRESSTAGQIWDDRIAAKPRPRGCGGKGPQQQGPPAAALAEGRTHPPPAHLGIITTRHHRSSVGNVTGKGEGPPPPLL